MRGDVQEYQARGWKVIPLNGKKPITQNWTRPASFPPEHWGNIGIITGLPSKLVVLDIDIKNGGFSSLDELEFIHGPLITCQVRTGTGGLHYYFKHPGEKIPNSVGSVAPGIDVRADGGMVVAPPSKHPDTGKPYRWEVPGEPQPLPPWLLNLVDRKLAAKARPASEWAELVHKGVKSGGRNNALASLSGLMLRHLPEEVVSGLLTAWNEARCEPPLTEEEVNAVVRSIARKEHSS